MQEQDETLLLEDVCVSRNQSPFTPVGVVGTSQAMYRARAYVSSSKHPLSRIACTRRCDAGTGMVLILCIGLPRCGTSTICYAASEIEKNFRGTLATCYLLLATCYTDANGMHKTCVYPICNTIILGSFSRGVTLENSRVCDIYRAGPRYRGQ